eukprot:2419410-Alexandrium_andersonii.AAC.1
MVGRTRPTSDLKAHRRRRRLVGAPGQALDGRSARWHAAMRCADDLDSKGPMPLPMRVERALITCAHLCALARARNRASMRGCPWGMPAHVYDCISQYVAAGLKPISESGAETAIQAQATARLHRPRKAKPNLNSLRMNLGQLIRNFGISETGTVEPGRIFGIDKYRCALRRVTASHLRFISNSDYRPHHG